MYACVVARTFLSMNIMSVCVALSLYIGSWGTTTFRPKIRRLSCQIFDTSLSHVRHFDFFLSVGNLSSVIRHLFNPPVKRHLSNRRLNERRRLSNMRNRRLSDEYED